MKMRFSSRSTHADDAPNALAIAIAAARGSERELLDLTISNPTSAGLPYDANAIRAAFGSERALVYEPEPFGLRSARERIACDHHVAPARVAITASTSEAYAILFKLFCDPGDEVLVPVPSYPLLAWLAQYESVKLVTYPLVYAGTWHVDLASLAASIGPRTRAIVVVNPNNPTGSYLGRDELDALLATGLPIVSDEVFSTYPLATLRADRVASVAHESRGLVFALSGLSKLVGLPQVKLGWMIAGGDPTMVGAAMARLENLLDAYLSVGTPVQAAIDTLLDAGRSTAEAIRARTRANLGVARRIFADSPASVLDVEGGWYVTLRVPETMTDERWALTLIEDERVSVQPGYFFDMHAGAHLVASLLTPEPVFETGMERIAKLVQKHA
jgi:alanine-synthesizing transaminase